MPHTPLFQNALATVLTCVDDRAPVELREVTLLEVQGCAPRQPIRAHVYPHYRGAVLSSTTLSEACTS